MIDRNATRRYQRGMVVLLLVVLVGIVAGSALLFSSRLPTADQAAAWKHNAAVMAQARAALLGRAVSNRDRPGALPCPDADNDGDAESPAIQAGNECPTYIGRLPWDTLNLPDLRDAAGERLWYALSPGLRNHSKAEPINSDTPGELVVTGPHSARDVAAIVFAPGVPLSAQVRDVASENDVRNYLERENSNGSETEFETAPQSNTFNDQLATITRRELFALVEVVVARRIEKEIKPLLMAMADPAAWATLPFAATFSNPATATYAGTPGVRTGLLPVADAWEQLDWSSPNAVEGPVQPPGSVVNEYECRERDEPPAASCNCSSGADAWCSGKTAPALRCRFKYAGSPRITVSAVLENAGRVFSIPIQASDLRPASLFNPVVERDPIDADGNVAMRATFSLPSGSSEVEVVIPAPCASPVSHPGSKAAGWFAANQWHRLLYYAATADMVPLGTCTGPGCLLSVDGLTPPGNKEALLVLAGQALQTQPARPQSKLPDATLADLLEGENQTPEDNRFAVARAGAAFNDRVVVLRP